MAGDTISRQVAMRDALERARQYIADCGPDDDPEGRAIAEKLLSEIDTALSSEHSARNQIIEEVAAELARSYPHNVNTNAFCAAIRAMSSDGGVEGHAEHASRSEWGGGSAQVKTASAVSVPAKAGRVRDDGGASPSARERTQDSAPSVKQLQAGVESGPSETVSSQPSADELKPWRDELTEIVGHLGAAIVQSCDKDDQIIMDHIKAAHEIAKIIRRKA